MHPKAWDRLPPDLDSRTLPATVGGDGVTVGEQAADGGVPCTCTGFAQQDGCPRCDGRGSEN